MTGVVYVNPPVLPEPPLPIWQGAEHQITGWDGTTFNLTTGDLGVYLLLDGVTGMHMPEFEQHIDEYGSVDGGTYQGSRTLVRNPSLTIGVFGDSTGQYLERDRALWRILHPDRPLLWQVKLPDGTFRTLTCQYRSSAEMQYGRDPVGAGWAVYVVDLLAADRPYWEGAPIPSPSWGIEADAVDYTGPSDVAPDHYVSGGLTLGSAEVTNPGDVDAWLTWTVTGPTDDVAIEAAGGSLGYGALASGAILRISTDPTRPVATLNGVDVSGLVDPWDPRPVPAGETSPLSIAVTGGGSVQASFTPRYFRAL